MKQNKKLNKRLTRLTMCLIVSIAFVGSFSMPIFATTGTSDPIQVVNNLNDFIFAIIRLLGIAIAGFGVFNLGISFSNHDPSQRSQGIMTLAGGLLIIFTKEIILMLAGG